MKVRKFTAVFAVLSLVVLSAFIGCRPDHRNGDRLLRNMDREVADLKLNDVQQKKYDVLRAKIKADIDAALAERKTRSADIDAELAKQNPDMTKVADIVKKGQEKRPAVAGRNIDEFVSFYNTLDDGQKAQVLARLRHFKERIDEQFE
jgi:hypothetical protein